MHARTALTLQSLNLKKPPPGTPDVPHPPDSAASGHRGHSSLAGKILHVFRVGGDNERSVGRHGQPAAAPAEKRTGPIQQQLITDGAGPVVTRTMEDSAPAGTSAAPLPDIELGQPQPDAAPAAHPEPMAPIRLQTFSIDLTERLARTRAAQQEVMRELDKFDETGEDLGKTVDRKR